MTCGGCENAVKRAVGQLAGDIIDIERIEDERGFFARSWCQSKFKDLNLECKLAQCNCSFNKVKGTLRGLHYQIAPYEEAKLIRCTAGAIYDVAVNVQKYSAAFKRWIGVELTAQNHRMLYVPAGYAHGFQTLADNTEVFYQVSEFYHSEHALGIRWNDPYFNIQWPRAVSVISAKDSKCQDFIP
jgi:dTDP-4-dehydrorhamnose 3,5-epimerase